jgi:hypothetical protein
MKTQPSQKAFRGTKRRLVVDRGTTIAGSRPWRHLSRLSPLILAARTRTNRARWLAISRGNTLAESMPMTQTLWSAGANSFRQVDAHGKAVGRRYIAQGPALGWYDDIKVVDQHGEVSLMAPGTRVRRVQAQEETLHSRFSRMLKAEFRRAP